MSLISTKNDIFNNRFVLSKMFIHIGAFVGEITILFVCMLWLKSEINVHLSYVHSVCFVYLSYFLEYIFCLPMLLFHVYILSIWVTFSRILFGITRIAPPPPTSFF